MTSPRDLRAALDPLAAVRAARGLIRTVPASWWKPPPTEDNPDPAPVETPERTEVFVDPAQLPEEIAPAGNVDLGAQVAMLQAAVAQWTDLEIRTVHGSVTFASTLNWSGNSTRDIAVTWSSTPLAPVKGAVARVDASIVAGGRVKAEVKPESITQTGCTVTVSVVGTGAVVITSALPLTVTVTGLYLYFAPFAS